MSKWQWPFVWAWRLRAEKKIAEAHRIRAAENRSMLERRQEMWDSEREQILADLDRILPKLTKAMLTREPFAQGPRIRCCVEIDWDLLRRGVEHGDDHRLFEYIGDDIKRTVVRDLTQRNFVRIVDEERQNR